MKWWHWLILELLIIFGVIAWIYFFPSEIEGYLAKGLIGFVLIYAIEECKDINRRKTMDYKEGMTCGKCLKYEFCPVANHNTNHKACMKITTKENHTVEQNTGENQMLEYMKKKDLSIADLEGNIAVQNLPFGIEENDGAVLRYWYKGELILSMKQRIYQVSPLETRAEMVIEKGDW